METNLKGKIKLHKIHDRHYESYMVSTLSLCPRIAETKDREEVDKAPSTVLSGRWDGRQFLFPFLMLHIFQIFYDTVSYFLSK